MVIPWSIDDRPDPIRFLVGLPGQGGEKRRTKSRRDGSTMTREDRLLMRAIRRTARHHKASALDGREFPKNWREWL